MASNTEPLRQLMQDPHNMENICVIVLNIFINKYNCFIFGFIIYIFKYHDLIVCDTRVFNL